MEFEYDTEKSKINAAKHGIDFSDARRLWLDEKGLVVSARSRTACARPSLQSLMELWTAIYTLRGESIRIISVRRSRDEERERYNNR
ncbi:MAG: BrnT family toxin [Spartobacteria bacterium]